jgi:hypothetical protein
MIKKLCFQLPYRQKEITTRELIKWNTNERAYTVPTKGQRTASRKITK